MNILHIEAIDSVWDEASPLLQKAIDHSFGEVSIQDVYKNLTEGQSKLIIITDERLIAAAVIEPVDYPQIRTARISFLGGERMGDWIPAIIEFITIWSEESGMDGIEVIGREGWVKMLKPLGFKKAYTHIIKEIQHG